MCSSSGSLFKNFFFLFQCVKIADLRNRVGEEKISIMHCLFGGGESVELGPDCIGLLGQQSREERDRTADREAAFMKLKNG